MEIEKSYRLSLKINAYILLIASLLHIMWTWFFSTYAQMKGLTELQWDWIYLLNLSTALCQFALSFLSFGASSIKSLMLGQLRAFSALMMFFWIVRFLLELVFPVQIPFLVLPDPSLFFKILIAALIAVLALPEIMFHIMKKKNMS